MLRLKPLVPLDISRLAFSFIVNEKSLKRLSLWPFGLDVQGIHFTGQLIL
jgi:hypothetical protein